MIYEEESSIILDGFYARAIYFVVLISLSTDFKAFFKSALTGYFKKLQIIICFGIIYSKKYQYLFVLFQI